MSSNLDQLQTLNRSCVQNSKLKCCDLPISVIGILSKCVFVRIVGRSLRRPHRCSVFRIQWPLKILANNLKNAHMDHQNPRDILSLMHVCTPYSWNYFTVLCAVEYSHVTSVLSCNPWTKTSSTLKAAVLITPAVEMSWKRETHSGIERRGVAGAAVVVTLALWIRAAVDSDAGARGELLTRRAQDLVGRSGSRFQTTEQRARVHQKLYKKFVKLTSLVK